MREEEKQEKQQYPDLIDADPESEEFKNPKNKFPWTILLVSGVLLVLMAVCIVIIAVVGGPVSQ